MPRGTDRWDEAQFQQRLWTPRLSSSLTVWFDAADLSTITIATGVSSWRDKSGFGNTVSQGTSGSQPTYSPSSFQGRPGLTFNGSSNRLNKTGSTFSCSAQWSCFGAFIPSSVSGVHSIFDTDWDTPTVTRRGQNLRTNGTALETVVFDTSNNAFVDTAPTTLAISTPYIASAVRRSASCEAYINGDTSGSTATTGTPNSGITVTMSVGAHPTTGQLFSGVIGEVLYFTTDLSQRERQIVEGYLAWKWRRSGNPLIGTHPFKNRPPLIGD